MALFSRRRGGKSASENDPTEQDENGAVAASADPETGGTSATGAEAEPASQDAPETETERPRPADLGEGPFDVEDAPEFDHIDLGALRVPMVESMELRMEMDQPSRTVTGVNLVLDGSSLQLQAFAAPRSRGLWDEVRTSLRQSVVEQGGTAETRDGIFGKELITRLPTKRADGRPGYRPARFVGVDGPRWFLRGIVTGPALTNKDRAHELEKIISRVVVVRGGEAMAPQELIPLVLPGQRPGLIAQDDPDLDPLGRGPEITEIG